MVHEFWLAAAVHDCDPGLAMASYDRMGEPPSVVGVVHETTTVPSVAPGVAVGQLIPGFTGSFSAVTPIGSLGRNTERADGYADVSFAIHKDFALTERLRLQVRSEVFNLFNTVNFLSYTTSLASPAFGAAQSVYGQRTMQLALRLSF